MESIFEGGAQAVFRQSLNPVQITKRAVKEMNRNKLIGTGKQYAPTLYNVLVSPVDDQKLTGFYPTMAREIEAFLLSKAQESGLELDGAPLVRFIVDDTLKKGKFDVIAESVASPIIKKLRAEEMFRYGLGPNPSVSGAREQAAAAAPVQQAQAPAGAIPAAGVAASGVAAQQAAAPLAAQAAQQFDGVGSNYDAQVADRGFVGTGFGEDAIADAPVDPWIAQDAGDSMFQPLSDAAAPVMPSGMPIASDDVIFGGASASAQAVAAAGVPVAQLIDVSTGDTYDVRGTVCMLGRESDCDIRILDANVSRHHATFTFENGEWMLEDLNSTNGTQINHHRISRMSVHAGDVIIVGVTKLQFQER